MEIIWDQLTAEEWQARLTGAGCAPLQQSWCYGQSMAAMGVRVRRALVRDAGREIAIAQVLDRGGLRVLLRGPVWLQPLVPQAQMARQVLRRLTPMFGAMIATPEQPVAGFGLVPLVTPRCHALWSLTPEADALYQGLHAKRRYDLRRAKAVQIESTGGGQILPKILQAEAQQRKARGYCALPARFVQHWQGPKLVLHWSEAGQVEAGMVVLIHPPMASYQIAWASPRGRAVQAHAKMLWQAALALKQRGITCFDLGDINSESGAGLMRFKLGCGAKPHFLGPSAWVLPTRARPFSQLP